jgi:hypothetical protein
MKLDIAEFKDFFQSDELKFNKKIVLLHPFFKTDNSIRIDEDLQLSLCMKWDEAIDKYFSGINYFELYIALEQYYYGSYYLSGGFGENQEFFKKVILPIIEILKIIPQAVLPTGEKLLKPIFKKIITPLNYHEFKVEAYITTQNIMTKNEILNQYDKMNCWHIKTVDNNINITTSFNSILTRIMWNDCEELQSTISDFKKYLDVIHIY